MCSSLLVRTMTIWKDLAAFATFESNRLLFRPFVFEDVNDFHAIVSNPSNLAFIFPGSKEVGESQEILVQLFMKAPLGIWALEDKKTRRMIGAIRLEKIDETRRLAEIGYFLHQDFWGQGLMTEALKNLVYLSFEELELQQLVLIAHLENIASQQVAQKAGFKLIRRYRGSDRYSHKMRDYCQFALHKKEFRLEMYEE